MMIDDMLDAPQQNDVKPSAASLARQKIEESLQAAGYTVGQGDSDYLKITKGTVSYTVAVSYSDIQSGTHFRIPIESKGVPSLSSLKSDCIGFYQKDYEGGTFFQIRLAALLEIVTPLAARVKEEQTFYAFAAHNAIALKRLHADMREDGSGYDYYLYLPIEAVCKKLKHSKMSIKR
jgi:hypothetical protein